MHSLSHNLSVSCRELVCETAYSLAASFECAMAECVCVIAECVCAYMRAGMCACV